MNAAQPNIGNRAGRRFVVPIGTIVLAAGCAAAATAWYVGRQTADVPLQPTTVAAAHACEAVSAASWSVGGKSDRTWAITTNLASCDDVRQRVSSLAGKDLVAMAQETNLRCTAAAIVAGQVLSGICYTAGASAGFFAWGAGIPPYDRPAPCTVCSGVPGEIAVRVTPQAPSERQQ